MADSLPPGAGAAGAPAVAPRPARPAPPAGAFEPGTMVGLVLAAGAGTRLRPLTDERPKPLCPVGGVPLLDRALAEVAALAAGGGPVGPLVVNAHHGGRAVLAHLGGRLAGVIEADGAVAAPASDGRHRAAPSPPVGGPSDRAELADAGDAARPAPSPPHDPAVLVSVEEPVALGTAGAIGRLVPWLAGRPVLVVNADGWWAPSAGVDPAPLTALVDGWDGERVRVLCHAADELGPGVGVLASLVPGRVAAALPDRPAGLWEVLWRQEVAAGRLEVVRVDRPFVDAGTPAGYLGANHAAAAVAGGALVDPSADVGAGRVVASVVGAGARVDGTVVGSVVWDGAVVEAGEVLVDAVRTTEGRTVLVRGRDGQAPRR